MADSSSSDAKLPLPAFLKVLSSNGVPARNAMAVAAKIYKTCNTTAALGRLTDLQLKSAGVSDKEDRKLVLAAVRKAGYKTSAASKSKAAASISSPAAQVDNNTRPKKKRKQNEDVNEFLPNKPADELEGASFGSLEFKETLDEESLLTKSTVINRAPIMMAWATMVAERIGFKREESLSIASVYTEMNAVTKGVSIGIYKESKKNGVPEPSKSGSQPYVELMGRRIPLYQTASNNWLGMTANKPTPPSSAYSYITRSLRQTTPHVLGAMRLLAESYEPDELNRKGFGLYCEFRPKVGGWGEKGEVTCENILKLRRKTRLLPRNEVKIEEGSQQIGSADPTAAQEALQPPIKQEALEDQKETSLKRPEPPDEFEEEFDDIDFGELQLP